MPDFTLFREFSSGLDGVVGYSNPKMNRVLVHDYYFDNSINQIMLTINFELLVFPHVHDVRIINCINYKCNSITTSSLLAVQPRAPPWP